MRSCGRGNSEHEKGEQTAQIHSCEGGREVENGKMHNLVVDTGEFTDCG